MVLVSGKGSNMQALLDAEQEGRLGNAHIASVLADRLGTFAVDRMKTPGVRVYIETLRLSLPKDARLKALSDAILMYCKYERIDLIVLAGFLSILQGDILHVYQGRIINLHPSLLPKYGGPGMYGARVHEAVLAAGERESGCTVHFVDEGTDTGPIILQRKVPVLPNDTPDTLAARIHPEEHIALVEAVRRVSNEQGCLQRA
jgi:phosphoribosylglycinamide formyltransferase-1